MPSATKRSSIEDKWNGKWNNNNNQWQRRRWRRYDNQNNGNHTKDNDHHNHRASSSIDQCHRQWASHHQWPNEWWRTGKFAIPEAGQRRSNSCLEWRRQWFTILIYLYIITYIYIYAYLFSNMNDRSRHSSQCHPTTRYIYKQIKYTHLIYILHILLFIKNYS